MKKSKKQNIILVGIAATIIIGIIGYSYTAEQTRQKGLAFGNELSQIQSDVKQIQDDFNSKIIQWDEGDLELQKLSSYADSHFERLAETVNRYDRLTPPTQFSASVELFKLSTSSQLQSDRHYMKWIEVGDKSHKIRSDALLQESFDFEMLALGEFNRAKMGYTEYDGEPAKFEAPDPDITARIDRIVESMTETCHSVHTAQEEIDRCILQADMWRAEHIP